MISAFGLHRLILICFIVNISCYYTTPVNFCKEENILKFSDYL